MRFFYDNTLVNYNFNKKNEHLIVFLHGWGAGSELLRPLESALEQLDDYSTLLIDFPPFGNSQEPKTVWTIYDYAELTKLVLESILLNNKFSKITIIGHSFGGRVAIILASQLNLNSLILIDSAGIKPKRNLKYYYKVFKYKILKKLKNKKTSQYGSEDYKKLSPIMKKTFVNIVNEDLTSLLPKISCKTLIIFGEKDKDTPVYMAKKFNKKIQNPKLILIKNSGHFSYLENVNFVSKMIHNYIL